MSYQQDAAGNDIRFVDVEGTDTILRVIKHNRSGKVIIIPISKTGLTHQGLFQAVLQSLVISGATTTVTAISITDNLTALASVFAVSLPIFTVMSKKIHEFFIKEVNFQEGGNKVDKKVFNDGEKLGIVSFPGHDLFHKSSEIIKDTYRNHIDPDAVRDIPQEVENMLASLAKDNHEETMAVINSMSKTELEESFSPTYEESNVHHEINDEDTKFNVIDNRRWTRNL